MTRLTDERLRHIKDAPEGCTLDLNGVEVQALVSELLLLRAECRAAREMRKEMRKTKFAGYHEFYLSGHQEIPTEIVAFDAARKATDAAGFSV